MPGVYLGDLSVADPMYGYLRSDIFSRYGSDCQDGIRVFGTNGSNAVYIYEDRKCKCKAVGKFFYSERNPDWHTARKRLDREYRNINRFASFLGTDHYVAKILGRNDSLNCLLVVEYCSGEPLDRIIMDAIRSSESGTLKHKLAALADFLASVHNRSAECTGVDFNEPCNYLESLLQELGPLLSPSESAWFRELKRRWHDDRSMWQDRRVLVHGDATPSNFFFGDGMYVISFDMERVRHADRCFDVGRIAGELQHFFLRNLHDRSRAEEFISHFLREYAGHFPDRESAFRAITGRLPFYMGTTLLRIARNTYLDRDYRRQLVESAEMCMRRKP